MIVQTGTLDDAREGGRLAQLWPLLWAVWLPSVVPAIGALLHTHPAPLRLGLVVAGLLIFFAVYLWAAWYNDVSRGASPASPRRASWRWRWGPIIVLATLSVVFILGDGPRWEALFIYTSATTTARLPLGQAARAVVVLMLLSVALGWLTADTWSDLALSPFWVGITGVLVIVLNYLRLTNLALRSAREEIAHLAIEAERLRFARDLHDLLGHDLARLALQSEVVEALVHTAPQQAVTTAREMGETARTALREVRAAVAGYRQPTLVSELRGAGEILAAAGIAYQAEGDRIVAPPAVEAALAWALREGVTNVVKHSRARHCIVRTTQDTASVSVEVSDDGAAASADAPTSGHGGSGLPGLTERAAALGGRCDAGPRPGGGFLLRVTLPLTREGMMGHSAAPPSLVGGAGDRP